MFLIKLGFVRFNIREWKQFVPCCNGSMSNLMK